MANKSQDMPVNATDVHSSGGHIVCYAPKMISASIMWDGDNPLDYSLPLFIVQMLLIVTTTRLLVFILKPLRQPRVVAEILGGILLGPSVFGRNKSFALSIFPLRGIMVLETMANVGLLYFVFLVGLEIDLNVLRRSGREAVIFAFAGMALPFVVGISSGYLLRTPTTGTGYTFLLFLGVAVSVTAFPVLARILADLKLINSPLGRLAMSAAIINDMSAWILLALVLAMSETKSTPMATVYVIASAMVFVGICIYVLRPATDHIVRNTPEGENFKEFYICLILAGVMICGFITDVMGTHSVFGAFVFGLVIPNGPLVTALVEKLEDFVTTLLLPLYFAKSGLKTNLASMPDPTASTALIVVFFLSSAAKVGATLFVALFYGMPALEGFCLGMLMNTKGLLEMIIFNVARDQKILDEQAFSIMVITAVVMTGITVPTVRAMYKPTRRYILNNFRTIQSSKVDSELRILVCIHTPRNVPTIINLIEATNPTKVAPICVFTLHLVELTGRASAMLIVHSAHKTGQPAVNRTQAQSEHIINSFETYAQQKGSVLVQPLTAISSYSTMHEDICNLAEDKNVSFIVVPFHKQQTVDGGMEVTNPAFRNVNKNVLANAPCSVGILIDRGFGGGAQPLSTHISHQIAVLFFGGPDDREALSYATRMAEHPGVNLTVVRFLSEEELNPNQRHMSVDTGNEKEKQLDNSCIKDFRLTYVNDEDIIYKEKVVNNGEETVTAIRTMDLIHNLYIVGRGQGVVSPLTAGLTDWSECPELGAIGDLLASSDFAATVSVLVVQQHIGESMDFELGTPDGSAGKGGW